MAISHRGECNAPTDVHRWQVFSTSCKFLKAAQRCCGRFCIDFADVDGDKGEAGHDQQTHISLWSTVCCRTDPETGATAGLATAACRHADIPQTKLVASQTACVECSVAGHRLSFSVITCTAACQRAWHASLIRKPG